MKLLKKLEKFESERLKKTALYPIRGGEDNQTASTYSFCHIDGVNDDD
jgi:hypothetical protein